MNPTVIEAAARTEYERVFGHIMPWSELADDLRACNLIEAETIITAALRELAPDIRAAVRMLSGAAQHYVDAGWRYGEMDDRTEQAAEGVNAARRDLLALLGIPEDGA